MKNLKEIRIKKGLTQQETARKLNITQSTYSGYEAGKYEPNLEMLIAISNLFDVSIDYLVDNKNKNVIDLSNLSNIRKELLFDILALDDFDCLEKYRAMNERKEWEQENPEKADELKRAAMLEREKEKEHFKYIIEKENKKAQK